MKKQLRNQQIKLKRLRLKGLGIKKRTRSTNA